MPHVSSPGVANMFDPKEKVARGIKLSKIYPYAVSYPRKNYELLKVVENRIEQFFAAHSVQCCQLY